MSERIWDDLNHELIVLGVAYKVDGDVMECRCCGRRIHMSRLDEKLRHGHDRRGRECKHAGDGNPWLTLADALDRVRVRASIHAEAAQ